MLDKERDTVIFLGNGTCYLMEASKKLQNGVLIICIKGVFLIRQIGIMLLDMETRSMVMQATILVDTTILSKSTVDINSLYANRMLIKIKKRSEKNAE